MNKTTAVLQWLQSHASISSMEAIKEFGATRLSAIIFRLREQGYNIEMEWCEGSDRFGHPMRYGRYFLKYSREESDEKQL